METKPGYLTTEFWVSILTGVWMLANTTGIVDQIPNTWAGVAMAIIGAAYSVSRGVAKQGVKPDVPVIVEPVPLPTTPTP